MAEQATINLNVRTDDSQKSLRAMRQELKQLQIAMDLVSDPAEFKRLAAEFAELRNDIADTSQAMKYLDPGELLSGWTKMAQGAIGAFGAVTGAMSLFGDESEAIQEIEKKSIVLIQTMMGLEQARQLLIDGGGRAQLKTLFATTAAQYKQVSATVAQWTAQKALNSSTMAGSFAFKAMGLAMKAIPFVAVAAAAIGLAVAVYKIAASYDTAAKTQKSYVAVTKAANESSAKEIVTASSLAAAIRKNIDNKAELSKLVKKWNEDYGVKYGVSLDATKLKLEDVALALDVVRTKLMENAMAAGAAARIEEIVKEDAEAYSKYVEAQSEIAEIRAQKVDWLKQVGMTDEEYQKMLASTGAADKFAQAIADVYDQFGVPEDLASELDMLFDLQAAFTQLGDPPPGGAAKLAKGIDDLRNSFYGALYVEMTEYGKKLDELDRKKKDNLVTEEEYAEGLYIINESHDRRMLELEESTGLDSLELKKLYEDKKANLTDEAAANELAQIEFAREREEKIKEGWYADEILKREGNFSKRLGMLKDFHDRGLILEEDYKKTVKALIKEQVGYYSDFISDVAGGMGDVFSNLTETAQMELDAQDKAWNDSWDAKYGKMDESMKRVADIYGTDSMEYAQALKEKEDADKLKADHDEDMEKRRKDADNKYKKGSIATDMVKATAEFAKASFGIWAEETSTKGPLGIPIALALQAMLAASFGTQMGVMSKQMSLIGKMRLGGPVFGPSHESGGVDRNLEGGEFVINAQSMKVPGVAQLANSLNRAGSAGSVPSVVDEASVRAIVNETVGAIAAIPVVVSERDITGTQRRVAVIESKTSF
jgi:hypothetical protein